MHEVILIMIILIITYYIINFHKESFNVFNSKYENKKNETYTEKNETYNKNKNIDLYNNIFIDDRILASKNKNITICKDYKLFGFAINPYNNIKFLLFEKYYKNNLFKYFLFDNQIMKIPPREKIFFNDIIYMKNYGYYKIISTV